MCIFSDYAGRSHEKCSRGEMQNIFYGNGATTMQGKTTTARTLASLSLN